MAIQVTLSSLDQFAAKSRGRTILVFSLGYAVFQPAMQLLLRLVGESIPFHSFGTFAQFELVMIVIGAAVGTIWFTLKRRPPSWRREWLDNSLRMTAFGCITVGGQMFAEPLIVWVSGILVSSVMLGGLWTAISRAAGGDPAAV
jgi:hypothetical protein